MQDLSMAEIDEVGGGIFINPWTAMIAWRVAQISLPYVQAGVIAAAGVIAGNIGWDQGTK